MGEKKSLKQRATQKKGGYWKGGKKSKPSYEGQQYKGGRKKGAKSLKRTADGNFVNQHGVIFTPQQKKALESAVNRVNYRRKKMLNEEASLPRKVAGRDTGDTVKSLQLMGRESDFILARKSKSLQRFKSPAEFEKYMKNLERVNSDDYLVERIRLYKRNHIQALRNVFGDDAKDVIMKIRMMKPEEYMRMLQSDEMLEVSFVYDPADASAKLNQIRASLGMKLKDDDDYIEE